uniref:(northern house mosquito) hypothetical protein n=1 Tax=Culex pipiens TaxID=7175 RepID=A0A8D8CXZ0_CULPI
MRSSGRRSSPGMTASRTVRTPSTARTCTVCGLPIGTPSPTRGTFVGPGTKRSSSTRSRLSREASSREASLRRWSGRERASWVLALAKHAAARSSWFVRTTRGATCSASLWPMCRRRRFKTIRQENKH